MHPIVSDLDVTINTMQGESKYAIYKQAYDIIQGICLEFIVIAVTLYIRHCIRKFLKITFCRIAQTDSASVQSPQLRKTSDLLDSLHEALNIDTKALKKVEAPHFRAEILINSANQLPSRRKLKGKSKKTKRKSGKQEENILPSTYVTFETMPGESLRFTSVFPKSTSPKWNFRCQVELPLDLVTNVSFFTIAFLNSNCLNFQDQKKLIFKVWRKSTNAVLQPNMQTDLVLGFAALDLSVLGLGFPSVQGWFNIIDFSGKCNGQINVGLYFLCLDFR